MYFHIYKGFQKLSECKTCYNILRYLSRSLNKFWIQNILQSNIYINNDHLKFYSQFICDLLSSLCSLLPNTSHFNSESYRTACNSIGWWRSIHTGQDFQHFADSMQKEKKTQRFYNCCDPLGVNVTAVLTAGKSRLLTAQQKRYRLPNISESVHEQTVLELLQDKLI